MTRNILNRRLLLVAYKTLVEALITYGVQLWDGLYNNAAKQINIVQNFLLKVIYKKKKKYQIMHPKS